MRFYGRSEISKPFSLKGKIFSRAFSSLYEARKKDGRPIGQLMGDAIKNSVNTLLLIGGFIILFSVIIRVMEIIGVTNILAAIIIKILAPLGISPELTPALISGIFEVTLGCQKAGAIEAAPLVEKTMAAGAIIAWSGLSVHAQVASIISKTDLSIVPFSCARLLHGFLAAFYIYLIMKPVETLFQDIAVPVFLYTQPQSAIGFWLDRMIFVSSKVLLFILIIFSTSMVIYFLSNLVFIYIRLWKN